MYTSDPRHTIYRNVTRRRQLIWDPMDCLFARTVGNCTSGPVNRKESFLTRHEPSVPIDIPRCNGFLHIEQRDITTILMIIVIRTGFSRASAALGSPRSLVRWLRRRVFCTALFASCSMVCPRPVGLKEALSSRRRLSCMDFIEFPERYGT